MAKKEKQLCKAAIIEEAQTRPADPLDKPIKREPDEGTGGVPLNKEEPASAKVDEEPRAKGLDGQVDGHASGGLLDQEKPELLKSAAVMSPAEQQALSKGRTIKPRGGAKKGKAQLEEGEDEEERDEDTAYYSDQPSKPMKPQKKKTPMKAAVKKATAEEDKKKKSRKSCAYHKTRTLKIREGFSEEEAIRLAKIVTCLHHVREPMCTYFARLC
ncbi:unnamed protein product [Symbiodinium sp. CCMP2592]|nr:unnamed protein product [Symbiodinium sp. CCMP2592]